MVSFSIENSGPFHNYELIEYKHLPEGVLTSFTGILLFFSKCLGVSKKRWPMGAAHQNVSHDSPSYGWGGSKH